MMNTFVKETSTNSSRKVHWKVQSFRNFKLRYEFLRISSVIFVSSLIGLEVFILDLFYRDNFLWVVYYVMFVSFFFLFNIHYLFLLEIITSFIAWNNLLSQNPIWTSTTNFQDCLLGSWPSELLSLKFGSSVHLFTVHVVFFKFWETICNQL